MDRRHKEVIEGQEGERNRDQARPDRAKPRTKHDGAKEQRYMRSRMQTDLHPPGDDYRADNGEHRNPVSQNRGRLGCPIEDSFQFLIEFLYFGLRMYWLRSFYDLPVPTPPEDGKLVVVH